MANTYLTWTPSGAGNRKTWTYSAWIKRSQVTGGAQVLLGCNNGYSTGTSGVIAFHANQFFLTYVMNGNGTTGGYYATSGLYRDTNAWYHIVLAMDTTQATESNRQKLWINGEQQNSFLYENYPTQNYDCPFNDGTVFQIGGDSASGNYFNGSMSHVHFIDGIAYDASTFGETDATTGNWKAKLSPAVTYGTNGFFLKFQNSGAFGTDSSGNGNNFTVNGTMTQAIDTPDNVFATLNSIHKGGTATHNPNFSHANTSVTFNSGDNSTLSTLGVSSGKYYTEFKVTNDSADPTVGVSNEYGNLVKNPGSCNIGSSTGEYGYFSSGNKRINGGSATAYGNSFTTNDIIGIALDLDNGAIWFSKNGTWQGSATITEIQNGTTTNAAATGLSGTFFFGCSNSSSGTTGDAFSVNFGNGYFGTTPVASPQNPDDGIGIFEYTVPTGYKALCTKSINAQEYN